MSDTKNLFKYELSQEEHKFRPPKYANIVAKVIKSGAPLLLVGPNGSGKTRLIAHIAKQLGQSIRRINFDGGMTPEVFLGCTKVRTRITTTGAIASETFFQEGQVVKAAQEGAILILDEFDRALPEYVTALTSSLENVKNPIVLNDDGGRIVIPHPTFRIVATANTLGRPEDMLNGYAAGAQQINASILDRFAVLTVGFPECEKDILLEVINDPTKAAMVEGLVKMAEMIRAAVREGAIERFDLSTRRLIAIVRTFAVTGSLKDALLLELIARMTEANQKLIEQFLQDIFTAKWQAL